MKWQEDRSKQQSPREHLENFLEQSNNFNKLMTRHSFQFPGATGSKLINHLQLSSFSSHYQKHVLSCSSLALGFTYYQVPSGVLKHTESYQAR